MITVWLNYKDGTDKTIECKQITQRSSGTLVIQYNDNTTERISGEKIDFYGVWSA